MGACCSRRALQSQGCGGATRLDPVESQAGPPQPLTPAVLNGEAVRVGSDGVIRRAQRTVSTELEALG